MTIEVWRSLDTSHRGRFFKPEACIRESPGSTFETVDAERSFFSDQYNRRDRHAPVSLLVQPLLH